MTSQQVSFHHISSAPKQRVFLNDLLHRRPSVPFCILDNRTKLQAEIRHTDQKSSVHYSDLEFIKKRRD